MKIFALPDISGDGAAHQLVATSTKAKWVSFSAIGNGPVRIGDASVTSSRGVSVPGVATVGGTPVVFPPDGSDMTAIYDLSMIYAYVPSGTTLTISYGV